MIHNFLIVTISSFIYGDLQTFVSPKPLSSNIFTEVPLIFEGNNVIIKQHICIFTVQIQHFIFVFDVCYFKMIYFNLPLIQLN